MPAFGGSRRCHQSTLTGLQHGDRVRFLLCCCYIETLFSDNVVKPKTIGRQPTPADDDDDETAASRFVARLIGYILKGFDAKDKNVRYRVLQITAEIMPYLSAQEYVLSPADSCCY